MYGSMGLLRYQPLMPSSVRYKLAPLLAYKKTLVSRTLIFQAIRDLQTQKALEYDKLSWLAVRKKALEI